MTILALDPGPTQTGWCIYDGACVLDCGVMANAGVLAALEDVPADRLAIEMIASYGMAVGREVFETCVWIGRFQQAWHAPEAVELVYRKDVKMHLKNVDWWHHYGMTSSTYTPEIAAKFCAAIADGGTLRSVCKKAGMPSKATVFRWLASTIDFAEDVRNCNGRARGRS
jgi:hypothetical protein